jgi:curved DNA-binding protein CbpA
MWQDIDASMENDLYGILQVAPHAEPEVIEAAWKRLSKKYHPDVNKAPDANERMKAINHAYDILRDPVQRERYDQKLHSTRSGPWRPAARPRKKRTPRPRTRATARRGTTPKPSPRAKRKTVKEELDVSESLVAKASKISKTHPILSSALLQKHLGITYPRAVYLFAVLIERGIIDEHGNWTARG